MSHLIQFNSIHQFTTEISSRHFVQFKPLQKTPNVSLSQTHMLSSDLNAPREILANSEQALIYI